MEDALCHIEITRRKTLVHAKVQTDLGGLREYKSTSLDDLLRQVVFDLQEEFENIAGE